MDPDRNLIFEAYLAEVKKPWSPIGPDADKRPKEGTPEGEEYETRHITPGPERERELKRRKEARDNKPKEEAALPSHGKRSADAQKELNREPKKGIPKPQPPGRKPDQNELERIHQRRDRKKLSNSPAQPGAGRSSRGNWGPREEGAFSGPGGNPDYDDIGQGQDTHDDGFFNEAEELLGDAIEQHEADRGIAYQMFDDQDWDEVFNLTYEAGPNDDNLHKAVAKLIKDKRDHDIQDEPPDNLHLGGHQDTGIPPMANEKPPFDSMGERGHAN